MKLSTLDFFVRQIYLCIVVIFSGMQVQTVIGTSEMMHDVKETFPPSVFEMIR
jgi:hypothetical protein